MVVYLIIAASILLLGLYLWDLRKIKLNVKRMSIIAMFSAMSFVLYLIQIVRMPQGGGISLFSMLPVILLAIIYDRQTALSAGLIFGLLKLLNGAIIVHPAQFLLDFILSTMVIGLAGMFGTEKKLNILLGAFAAMMLSTFVSVISGVVFFAQYCPEGMNLWWYSITYNYGSQGVEALLTIILMYFLPIDRLKKIANKYV